ncbi:glycosyltransferase [candidate division WS5 bacterium]|uniref:Glycosyltransferase n=1 Tax=candidate division WS5 bacterium TaxID=2093353 RepID=A0A419DDP7_9BACT|nr:MAG: glycosyltransferase [candidate division WS5 bacterium]
MPEISIVIPIHNEEKYLLKYLTKLTSELETANVKDYEIVLAENGSTDKTREIANGLAEKLKTIRLIILEKADYGAALKKCMMAAQGMYIIQYDLDYWDVSFLKKTVLLMKNFEYNIIIGSKNMLLSKDERHPVRRIISQGFRLFLTVLFGLKVSDTHGVKAFKNDDNLKQIISETRFKRHIFDTELVIRAQRKGLNIIELPMSVIESRPSPTKTIIKRVPEAIADLISLWKELSVKKTTKNK